MKFQTKILFITLSVTVPIIIVMGMINYYLIQDEITRDTLEDLNTFAVIQETKITNIIEQNLERLQGITSRTQLRISLDSYNLTPNIEDQQRIQKIIQDAKSSLSDFQSIAILNINGEIVASTTDFDKSFFAETLFFKNGLTKNNFDFTMDINNKPQIVLSGPLTLDDKLVGVAIIITNSKSLENIAKDQELRGDTTEILLAKRTEKGDALFITPLRFEADSQFNKIVDKSMIHVPITQSMLNNEQLFTETIDYRGESVLAATKYIESVDWGLVVKIDKTEAFQTIETIQTTTIFAIIFLILFYVIISLFLSKQLIEPIQELSHATKSIAKGNYDISIPVRDDEFSFLTKDFQKMASQLKQTKKQVSDLKEVDKLKGEFLSMISHELKTPLTPIRMYTEMLLRDKDESKLSEKQKNKLTHILDSSINLQKLIDDFLDTNRLELGSLKLNKQNIKVQELLQMVKEYVKPFLLEKNIDFVLYDVKRNWTITCDPDRILQVFSNLVKNSVDFVSEQGKISIHTQQSDNLSTIFTVDDNGPGIAKTHADDLFKKFFQIDTSSTRKHGGVGLGLAICKGLVEAHGGEIWIDTSYDAGTRIKFSIPYS